MASGIRYGRLDEIDDEEARYEYLDPSQFLSSNANHIPYQNTVQGTRAFYGSRFIPQSVAQRRPEAAWVQNLNPLDKQGRSFDQISGKNAGAVFADDDGDVEDVTPNRITYRMADGTQKVIPLYQTHPYNRKSGLHQTPVVEKGQKLAKGAILARSNFTDAEGTLALGRNARVGLLAHKGDSMDDAVVISQAFADAMESEHIGTYEQDWDEHTRGGRDHFTSLFAKRFDVDQIAKMDEDGFVKPGQILNPGDPISLATVPRSISSATAALGGMSRTVRLARRDASQVWQANSPGEVTDVVQTKHGKRAVIRHYQTANLGDKVAFRSGAKGTISKIIANDRMPRTEDGLALDVLSNHLGLVSRANSSLPFEALMGKIAAKTGQPLRVASFNPAGTSQLDIVQAALKEHGLTDKERVFDPGKGTWLRNPITVGNAYLLKLHHTADCFDDQTEVLTEDGWKWWKDVGMHDFLATSDERGQELRFEKPLHLMSYDFDGLMCAFQGRYLDYCVTPNHNLWQKAYYGQRTFALCQASQLHNTRFKMKQFGLIPTCPGGPEKIVIESRALDWDDFCELTGWWLAEGCVSTNKAGILIYQSSTANPEKVARIEALLNRLDLRWSHYLSAGVIMGFAVNEKFLARYFEPYGMHSELKQVPRELVRGRLSGCRRIIESLILGDGSTCKSATGPSTRLVTTSPTLADDFQELCVRVGAGSIVSKAPRELRKKLRDNPHHLDYWECSYTISRQVSQVDGDRNGEGFTMKCYRGRVYCAEMSSGLLYVRRNGKPMLTGNSKASSRGTAAYDGDEQPVRGGGDSAQAKRLSGLESHALLSAGAYAVLREGATLRGQKNDAYWRALRQGQTPKAPGSPFVWDKFQALLAGTGMLARNLGDGRMRLGPFTDQELDKHTPIEIRNGGMLDLKTMEPTPGGLFDPSIAAANKWGVISLPRPVPNPAFEEGVRAITGMTRKEFQEVLDGDRQLPPQTLIRIQERMARTKAAEPDNLQSRQ